MDEAPNPQGFDDALREICQDRCQDVGDPPCWKLPLLSEPCEHITPCAECLTDRITELSDALAASQAEVERLRVALTLIASHREKCHAYDSDVGHALRDFSEEDVKLMEYTARAALAKPGDG